MSTTPSPAGTPGAGSGRGRRGGTAKNPTGTVLARTDRPVRQGHGPMAGGPAQKSLNFRASGLRLLGLLTPMRAQVVAAVALTIVSVALSVAGPKILGHATDLVFRCRGADVWIESTARGGHQIDRNGAGLIRMCFAQAFDAATHRIELSWISRSKIAARRCSPVVSGRRGRRPSPKVFWLIESLADQLRTDDIAVAHD